MANRNTVATRSVTKAASECARRDADKGAARTYTRAVRRGKAAAIADSAAE